MPILFSRDPELSLVPELSETDLNEYLGSTARGVRGVKEQSADTKIVDTNEYR